MFDWDVERNGEVAWIAQKKDGEAGTIATVKKVLGRNTPLMTRYSFEGKGGLANETLYSAKKAKEVAKKFIAKKLKNNRSAKSEDADLFNIDNDWEIDL